MPKTAYDQFKEHEGKRYTGMKIGRGHKWQYDAGQWTEKKVTPDKWEFQYSVVKRRKGRAPEGSGAPVGTAYYWYIVARQIVTKVDANSYATEVGGAKYKVSHKRADKTSWSASNRARLKRTVQILRDMIAEIERQEPLVAEPRKMEKERPRVATRRRAKTAQRRRPRARPNRRRTAAGTHRRRLNGR